MRLQRSASGEIPRYLSLGTSEGDRLWTRLRPQIVELSRPLFENGADMIEVYRRTPKLMDYRYHVVLAADGSRLIGCLPLLETRSFDQLQMLAKGPLRSFLEWGRGNVLRPAVDFFMKPRMLVARMPMAHEARFFTREGVEATEVISQLTANLLELARRRRASDILIPDVRAEEKERIGGVLHAKGFGCYPFMPGTEVIFQETEARPLTSLSVYLERLRQLNPQAADFLRRDLVAANFLNGHPLQDVLLAEPPAAKGQKILLERIREEGERKVARAQLRRALKLVHPEFCASLGKASDQLVDRFFAALQFGGFVPTELSEGDMGRRITAYLRDTLGLQEVLFAPAEIEIPADASAEDRKRIGAARGQAGNFVKSVIRAVQYGGAQWSVGKAKVKPKTVDEMEKLLREDLGRGDLLDAIRDQNARTGFLQALVGESKPVGSTLTFEEMVREEDRLLAELGVDKILASLASKAEGTRVREALRNGNFTPIHPIRYERVSDPDQFKRLIPQLYPLYAKTNAQAGHRMEVLTPDYFAHVKDVLGDRASFLVQWVGETPIWFVLAVHDPASGYYSPVRIGMDYDLSLELESYDVGTVFSLVEAMHAGAHHYNCGPTTLDKKAQIGLPPYENFLFKRKRGLMGLPGIRSIDESTTRKAMAGYEGEAARVWKKFTAHAEPETKS